jgi:hypothetical protein
LSDNCVRGIGPASGRWPTCHAVVTISLMFAGRSSGRPGIQSPAAEGTSLTTSVSALAFCRSLSIRTERSLRHGPRVGFVSDVRSIAAQGLAIPTSNPAPCSPGCGPALSELADIAWLGADVRGILLPALNCVVRNLERCSPREIRVRRLRSRHGPPRSIAARPGHEREGLPTQHEGWWHDQGKSHSPASLAAGRLSLADALHQIGRGRGRTRNCRGRSGAFWVANTSAPAARPTRSTRSAITSERGQLAGAGIMRRVSTFSSARPSGLIAVPASGRGSRRMPPSMSMRPAGGPEARDRRGRAKPSSGRSAIRSAAAGHR